MNREEAVAAEVTKPVIGTPVETQEKILGIPDGCVDSYFVRDSDIDAIKDLMNITGDPEKARHVQFLTSIQGFPGIGKSELAIRLARDHDVLKTFSHGAHRFECRPPGNLRSEDQKNRELLLSQIHERFTTQRLDDVPLLSQMQQRVMESLRDQCAVIILDDLWDAESLNVVQKVLPPQCSILVTTSVPRVADEGHSEKIRIYDVPPLQKHSAKQLFTQIFQSAEAPLPSAKLLSQILQLTEYLPAAIIIAARIVLRLRRQGLSDSQIGGFIRKRLGQELQPRVSENAAMRSINTVLSWAIKDLSDVSQSALSQLRQLKIKSSTVDEPALKAVWGSEADVVIDELLSFGLIRYIGMTDYEERRFQVNRFVYDFVSRMPER